MQGSFQATLPQTGTDWGAILDPGPDEETLAEQRQRAAAAEMDRLRRMRDDGGRDGAARAPVQTPVPHAPSPKFQLNGTVFYIVREIPALEPRVGQWGHYLVSYKEERVARGVQAVPYRPGIQYRPLPTMPRGAPGTVDGDPTPRPDLRFCKQGVHFVCADPENSSYYEIGVDRLRATLEEAEALDLAFARRMEGLANVNKSVMWDCLDPDYDASDREGLMEQFMSKYLERFYTRLEPGNTPDVRSLTEEALHKHKAFCKAWTQKHYKTLTPTVTAPAETLVNEFYPYLESIFPRNHRLTRAELARVLMRHEEFSADFATCLHYYTTSLEQGRAGRNASYKQMSQISTARAMSYTRMGNVLSDKMDVLTKLFRGMQRDPTDRWLHPLLIDWHSIMGQIPQVHRYFDDDAAQHGGAPRVQPGGGQVPPWRITRM